MSSTVHATALVYGSNGLLLCGPSGAGKSLLFRDLLAHATASGQFAALIGDDRVRLDVADGRLIARPVAPIAGLAEMRGLGPVPFTALDASVIRLVVDFVPHAELERLPEETELSTEIMGLSIRRQPVPSGGRPSPDLVLAALAATRPVR
ncbi:MAG: serine/threonine protein kinase [Pseudomonadota bacterium]